MWLTTVSHVRWLASGTNHLQLQLSGSITVQARCVWSHKTREKQYFPPPRRSDWWFIMSAVGGRRQCFFSVLLTCHHPRATALTPPPLTAITGEPVSTWAESTSQWWWPDLCNSSGRRRPKWDAEKLGFPPDCSGVCTGWRGFTGLKSSTTETLCWECPPLYSMFFCAFYTHVLTCYSYEVGLFYYLNVPIVAAFWSHSSSFPFLHQQAEGCFTWKPSRMQRYHGGLSLMA